jgi:hypothetical protein
LGGWGAGVAFWVGGEARINKTSQISDFPLCFFGAWFQYIHKYPPTQRSTQVVIRQGLGYFARGVPAFGAG